MPRTPVRRVAQGSASLQALVPWCSSCNRLMGEMVRCAGEVNYFRYYKKLGPIAKLATSYVICPRHIFAAPRFLQPPAPRALKNLRAVILGNHPLHLGEQFALRRVSKGVVEKEQLHL